MLLISHNTQHTYIGLYGKSMLSRKELIAIIFINEFYYEPNPEIFKKISVVPVQ